MNQRIPKTTQREHSISLTTVALAGVVAKEGFPFIVDMHAKASPVYDGRSP